MIDETIPARRRNILDDHEERSLYLSRTLAGIGPRVDTASPFARAHDRTARPSTPVAAAFLAVFLAAVFLVTDFLLTDFLTAALLTGPEVRVGGREVVPARPADFLMTGAFFAGAAGAAAPVAARCCLVARGCLCPGGGAVDRDANTTLPAPSL